MTTNSQQSGSEKARLKQSIRAKALARRMRLDREIGKAASPAFVKSFKIGLENGHIPQNLIKEVAAYVAMRGEADPFVLFDWLRTQEAQFCLPVVAQKSEALVFRRYEQGDALDSGVLGTNHPPADRPEILPTLVIVPLVAFDKRGYRVGYGGGYYDRTIEKLENCAHGFITMGLAYAGQKVDEIPAERHDKPLDMVLTEQGLQVFNVSKAGQK